MLNQVSQRYDPIKRELLAIIPFQKFKELEAFRRAFDLDLKKELRELRRQLRKKHNRAERICEKLDEERVEKSGLPWASYREVKRKFDKAKDQQHELYRELINFEYFLVRFGYFSVLDQEIDVIIDKVQDLDEWEEERKWEAIADTIFEYWDDEDPDTVFE